MWRISSWLNWRCIGEPMQYNPIMKNYLISFNSSQMYKLNPCVKEKISGKNSVEVAIDEEQSGLITFGSNDGPSKRFLKHHSLNMVRTGSKILFSTIFTFPQLSLVSSRNGFFFVYLNKLNRLDNWSKKTDCTVEGQNFRNAVREGLVINLLALSIISILQIVMKYG